MQNALWKLTALAGVIGVGVLVVLQAQNSLKQAGSGAEEFTELELAEGGDDAGSHGENSDVIAGSPADEQSSRFLSDFGAELPPQSEAVRTASTSESGEADVSVAEHGDEWQGAPAEDTSTQADPGTPSDNPFAGLVELAATAPATIPASDGGQSASLVNPFTPDTAAPGGLESAANQATDAQTAAPVTLEEAAMSGGESQENDSLTEEVPSAVESNAELSVLPPDHPGPALMMPPVPNSAVHAVAEMEESVDSHATAILPASGASSAGIETPNPFGQAPADEAAQVAEPPALLSSDQESGAALVTEPELQPEPTPVSEVNSLPHHAEPPPELDWGAGTFEPASQALAAPESTGEQSTPEFESPGDAAVVSEPTPVPELTLDGDVSLPDGIPVLPETAAETAPVESEQPSLWGDAEGLPALEPEESAPTSGNLPAVDIFPGEPQPSSGAPDLLIRNASEQTFAGNGVVSEDIPAGPQQPQVNIEKQAPPHAVLGQPMIYTIVVRNLGGSAAKNVVVEDRVPLGTNLTGTDPRAEYLEADGRLMWQLGRMEPGSEKTIRVRVIPTDAGQIGSVATVSFEAEVASRTIINAPKLQFALEGPDEVRVGEQARFRFVVSNEGSAEATGVIVRSLIPQGFEHPGGNDLEYEVGLLPQGQSREVELNLLAVAAGQFEKRALLSAESGINIESVQPVTILNSRFNVSRKGPENRFVGRELAFANTVTNVSREPLSGITIEETVPAGLDFRDSMPKGQFDPSARRLLWRLPRLEPGESVTLTSRFIAVQEGDLTSTVRAVDDRGDSAELASRTKVIGFSSLKVDVSHAGRPVAVGEEVALRLTVRNGGTAAARQVGTWIEIPRQLRFQSAQGPVRFRERAGGIEFEPIEQLARESEQTFDVVMTAAEPGDARVRVHLASAQLQEPISEEESIVIFAEGR